MTDSSNPRSIRPVKPVDPLTCQVLRAIDRAAAAAGCDCFVAGATARDLMLVNAFGLPDGRATRDIDFGIAVESWDEFESLRGTLIASGRFGLTRNGVHRLLWRESEAGLCIPVDIIPFGGVATDGHTIAWPPHRDIEMNVAGFEEAHDSSVHLQVEDGLLVRVASLPGLAVLKILAWRDRRMQGNKDALDLFRLLRCYADAGNLDRLYDAELHLLENAGFDLALAGSELLGRDAALVCRPETRDQIAAILASEELVEALALQMDGRMFQDEVRMDGPSTLIGRFQNGFLAASRLPITR